MSDCTSDTDDDGITLKSGCALACEDIVVTNCIVRSPCNAIKLGTESNGGFRRIAISNCVLAPSDNPDNIHGFPGGICGIAVEMIDGGALDGVVISDVVMHGPKVPIFVRLGNRARPFLADGATPGVGTLHNVSFHHITGSGLGDFGCFIAGLPGHPTENLSLSDIRLEFSGGHSDAPAPESVPEKEADYPEATMFGHAPAWGFFFRHVGGLRMQNMNLTALAPDARPEITRLDVL